ncbi:hypothetical protein [Prescottella agglutinans]|uniref:DUF7229 domain-containing protein n=1 Tax=Prescottella agglutinans TaxID=1644129 RepID=A0ABT6MJN9_9NOCA|nr:hypothetical protein [Prescottella agglutinans]MDH6284532.1 hypothetical protein [Prescottella agglutinans]
MSHTLTPVSELPGANAHFRAPDPTHRLSESADNAADARLDALLAANSCPRTYFVSDVAALFGKSDQWVHWVLRNVTHPDGSPIEPERIGKQRRKRFTRPLVESIVVALHHRGTLTRDGACRVIANLDAAEGLAA